MDQSRTKTYKTDPVKSNALWKYLKAAVPFDNALMLQCISKSSWKATFWELKMLDFIEFLIQFKSWQSVVTKSSSDEVWRNDLKGVSTPRASQM